MVVTAICFNSVCCLMTYISVRPINVFPVLRVEEVITQISPMVSL